MTSNEREHGGENERPTVARTPFSLRLTFSYDRAADQSVGLAGVERIRAIAPGIATDPPRAGQSGAWVEVRDADDRLLYYRHLHDPIPSSVEVFADESGEPSLSRRPTTSDRSEFSIVVPDLPDAAQLIVYLTPVRPAESERSGRRPRKATAAAPQAAEPVGEFSFEELRRRTRDLSS
jgi:hypothetical protein